MAIQTSTNVSPVLANLLTNWAVAEQGLNAVERVDEYSKLEAEKFTCTKSSAVDPPKSWPSEGKIEFKNVVASYRADLAPILRGMNITIQPSEKIGIVGRTGAGKS